MIKHGSLLLQVGGVWSVHPVTDRPLSWTHSWGSTTRAPHVRTHLYIDKYFISVHPIYNSHLCILHQFTFVAHFVVICCNCIVTVCYKKGMID